MSIDATNALLRFARRWFDERTVTSVFEPLLADHQRVWLDAAPAARFVVSLKTAAAFITAVLCTAPRAVLFAPVPPSTTRRVLARIIIFTGIVATLFTIAILMDARAMTPLETITAAIFVLPAGIGLAFPFSLLWAGDAIRRARVATAAERAAALRAGIVAVAFMLVLVGWGVPAMNQLYRDVAAPEHMRRPIARGVREATLDELLSRHPPRLLEARSPANLQREATNRVIVTLLPAILLWLRWSAHEPIRKRWWTTPPVAIEIALAAVLYFLMFWVGFQVEMRFGLEPGLGMWLPVLAFISAGFVRQSLAKRVAA